MIIFLMVSMVSSQNSMVFMVSVVSNMVFLCLIVPYFGIFWDIDGIWANYNDPRRDFTID